MADKTFYEKLKDFFPNFDSDGRGTLMLYISGSQGVSPNEQYVHFGSDFNDLQSLMDVFKEFITENAYDYVMDYLEDNDDDDDEAMNEVIMDSGIFYIIQLGEDFNKDWEKHALIFTLNEIDYPDGSTFE